MKILHTSDWHLGAADGNRSLAEDQVFFIDEICRIIRENTVDAVIIAGDVYDKSVSSAEAIKLYDSAMTKICGDMKTPVMIIAGNHDSAERLASCSELLSHSGLYISGSLQREVKKVSFDDTDVYLLPWITEEKVKSIYPEKKDEITSFEDAFRVVTDGIRESFDETKKHIIVSHAFITDSETSTSDRAAEIGFATQVPASVFEGFDYVALGHIHKPQDVNDHIRYSGTPMPYSFGKEEKQEKSVTVINTDDMSREIISVPLLHKRVTITGEYEEILSSDYDDEIKNGYVRLQITDQYVGMEALSELKKEFLNLIEVTGKQYEGDGGILLTQDELEKLETNPTEIFRHFCREEMNTEPDDHLIELFEKAVEEAEK